MHGILWSYGIITKGPTSISLELREKEIVTKKVFEEIMAENIPNFVKNTNLHIQQDKPTPNGINLKKNYTNIS